jgi:hypothetical protein
MAVAPLVGGRRTQLEWLASVLVRESIGHVNRGVNWRHKKVQR